MAKILWRIPFLIFITIVTNLQSANSEPDIKRISFSTRGIECATPCSTKGEKYFWCDLVTKGWDYCSTSPLLDYTGNKCEFQCGHHGEKYQWCWTKNGDWGYCSRDAEEVHVTHFGATDGKKCTSTCAKHGSKYYWCSVDKADWDYCSPQKGRNSGGTKCKTECKKQDAKYKWCNDENDKWQYCSEVKIETLTEDCSPIIDYSTGFKLRIPQMASSSSNIYNAKKKYVVRRSLTEGKVSKRSSNFFSSKRNNLHGGNLCEKLAANVLAKNKGLEEFTPDENYENPIVDVWYSGVKEKRIPHIIHSRISHKHRICNATNFGLKEEFNRRMTLMNANPKDIRSHIISTKLCGPSVWYNFVPKKKAQSITGDFKWDSRWEWLSEKLEHNPCSILDLWVILKYHEGNKRPQHFKLCYTFKDVATEKVTFGPETEIFENL